MCSRWVLLEKLGYNTQHLIFGIKAAIEWIVPDMPHDIKIKMQREDFLTRENVRKMTTIEEIKKKKQHAKLRGQTNGSLQQTESADQPDDFSTDRIVRFRPKSTKTTQTDSIVVITSPQHESKAMSEFDLRIKERKMM